MTPSTTPLAIRARTWLLVAGLTALMIGFGTLIGGGFAWLFAVVAVIFNLLGYLCSDRIALRAVRAEPLARAAAPEVHEAVRELAALAHIPPPRLYVMPGEQANAFAIGRGPTHAAVVMTEGLLTDLPLEQVRGVAAHELAHIGNRDILVSSVAAMIAGAIAAVANAVQLSFLLGERDDNPLRRLGTLAATVLAPIGAALLALGISRRREYLADATAAKFLGRAAPLADALETIAGSTAPALPIAPVTAPMYIASPLPGARGQARSGTHPSVAERVRRLRAYDAVSACRPPSPAQFSDAVILFDAR